jgi:hypothetical protein
MRCGLIDFTSRLRICHSCRDIIFAGEGLQNLGLGLAFKQEWIFIMPHLL